jgi:uncharacterized protein (TIGR02266 family)
MGTKRDRRSGTHSIVDDRRPGIERRQWERVLVDFEVDYGHDDTFLFAYITDISQMGIFVYTHTPEPAGTRLNLRFSPPGMTPMECEGVVIWINPYRPGDRENLNPGMGIKFVDLTYEQREGIKELVRTFAYLSSDDDEHEAGGDGGSGPPSGGSPGGGNGKGDQEAQGPKA